MTKTEIAEKYTKHDVLQRQSFVAGLLREFCCSPVYAQNTPKNIDKLKQLY